MKVARMLPPEEYDMWRDEGMAMGFKYVASGPLVRSSYKAGEVFMEAILKEREVEKLRREGLHVDVEPAVIDGRRLVGVRGAKSELPRQSEWKPTDGDLEAREARIRLSQLPQFHRSSGACPT